MANKRSRLPKIKKTLSKKRVNDLLTLHQVSISKLNYPFLNKKKIVKQNVCDERVYIELICDTFYLFIYILKCRLWGRGRIHGSSSFAIKKLIIQLSFTVNFHYVITQFGAQFFVNKHISKCRPLSKRFIYVCSTTQRLWQHCHAWQMRVFNSSIKNLFKESFNRKTIRHLNLIKLPIMSNLRTVEKLRIFCYIMRTLWHNFYMESL